MVILQLTSSRFFGGPERQMLELARHLPAEDRTVFLSFAEGGASEAFLRVVRDHGFTGVVLEHDTPHFLGAVQELARKIRQWNASILCCHGYKADILGRPAARLAGVPVISVSRGWTWESAKVRAYEALDRIALRGMDRVVCVSEGQAAKVRRAGVRPDRVLVIRNAIRVDRFPEPDHLPGEPLWELFAEPPDRIVGAAGRLSPEKGFDVLVEAARKVVAMNPAVGFILFGEGPLHDALEVQIDEAGLEGRFILAGFRPDLDQLVPRLDLMVLSSHTEGLPNVVLEALAASVPVVATAVGGTPEVIEDGVHGYLVPPGDAEALAGRIRDALASEPERLAMGVRGRRRVEEEFTFEAQSQQYQRLFRELAGRRGPARRDEAGRAVANVD
jgi:glycosyltransferase involved in cell wall biosynthesis